MYEQRWHTGFRGRSHVVRPQAMRIRPRNGIPTVLVVDDEDPIRDFLRSALEAEGYQVLAAGDGHAALALCERYHPDLILLDLMMPKLDGLGFLHEFRRRYGENDVPVLIMSAVRNAVEHAEAAGVAATFPKPFDLDELIETIASMIATGAAEADAGDARPRRNV